MIEVGKKYNERTLYRMRKFYEIFSNEKLTPLVSKLTWSHYIELFSIKDLNKILYYIDICEKNNYTKRELREKIRSNEYERLTEETKRKLRENEELTIKDIVPDSIIIKSDKLDEELTEYTLKQIILNHLDEFLLQLGNSFSYIGNEYKIKIGNSYNYIDILLFNYEYNAFVVVELKVTELKKEHIGQIQVYMNYIDSHLRKINHDKTIGIVICKKNNKFIIEYCSDSRIIGREYKIVFKNI